MKLTCLESQGPSGSGRWGRGLMVAAAVLGISAAWADGEIVYDFTAGQLTNNHFRINGNIELGDEVLLSVPGPVILTGFAFDYYGLNFSGNEQVRLRFYQQNTLIRLPDPLVFDSGWMGLPAAPEGATFRLTNFTNGVAVPLTNRLPVDITWSVTFQGLEAPEEAGLLMTVPKGPWTFTAVRWWDILPPGHPHWEPAHAHGWEPADVGMNSDTYWQRFSSGWSLMAALDTNQSFVPICFRARIEGELPEGHFLTPTLQNGELTFALLGESGRRYLIQTSPDLEHWTELKTDVAIDGRLSVSVPAAEARQFIRARLVE